MRFTQTVFALAALTSAVFADDPTAGFDAFSSPSVQDQQVPAGSQFTISWSAATHNSDSDTVSIILLAGDNSTTLQPGDTITSLKNSAGNYTWTVPTSVYKTYGFKIELNNEPAVFQYSYPFHITGGSSSSSGSSSANSSASASTVTAVTSSANSTTPKTAIASITSNSTATAASNSTSTAPTTTGSSNTTTLQSTVGATKTTATTVGGSATAASSSSAKPSSSGNAAASNMAQGGIALVGGLVLAFAL